MSLLDALQLMLSALQLIAVIAMAFLTTRLQRQVHRLDTGLDQSIQILHRAREAVIKIHTAEAFLVQYRTRKDESPEDHAAKYAEMLAYEAELEGLASATGDKELITLVNKVSVYAGKPVKEQDIFLLQAEITLKSRNLHTRISQLLEAATK